MGYLLWLVIDAGVLRRQRGIPFVAHHTCMCLAVTAWDTFCGSSYMHVFCGGKVGYLLWFFIHAYVLQMQRVIHFCGSL